MATVQTLAEKMGPLVGAANVDFHGDVIANSARYQLWHIDYLNEIEIIILFLFSKDIQKTVDN